MQVFKGIIHSIINPTGPKELSSIDLLPSHRARTYIINPAMIMIHPSSHLFSLLFPQPSIQPAMYHPSIHYHSSTHASIYQSSIKPCIYPQYIHPAMHLSTSHPSLSFFKTFIYILTIQPSIQHSSSSQYIQPYMYAYIITSIETTLGQCPGPRRKIIATGPNHLCW